MSSKKYYYGTGKRKSAIARVRVFNTPGEITVNGKTLEEAIPVEIWQKSVTRPLDLLDLKSSVTVVAKTHGGGISGQADALSLGISRALIEMDSNLRSKLKSKGLLTRDSRIKESKKYGLKRARKAQQFTKR
ncbi:MAG: 30S ribosomal protein S9 [Dehalococcoidia bacterium]|nr:30S ribosomal protein S9 [Dehalococcoidia bacterium]MEC7921193.1 30S ribosomal protein S9 [Chloroflexota bacterium]MEC9451688.1 30S ribosomal protein S9 [Chloroflexota bacterium]